MRALVLAFLLAGCGLRAIEPAPPPRIDASDYICTEPGMHLVTLETASGDILAACEPVDSAAMRGWKYRDEGSERNADPNALP